MALFDTSTRGRASVWPTERVFYPPRPVADPLTEILCLARLYLEAEEVERLVVWIANRLGRNQALAGDRTPLERLEHVARHWLMDEERESLARWMLSQAGVRAPIVPERPVVAAGAAKGMSVGGGRCTSP